MRLYTDIISECYIDFQTPCSRRVLFGCVSHSQDTTVGDSHFKQTQVDDSESHPTLGNFRIIR